MTPDPAGAAPLEWNAYNQLQAYTLGHGDPRFIHQHVVDAWAAQHANQHTRPIALTFALVGLYLHLERGFTGRQVQLAHMALGVRKRDQAIDAWCASVWDAFRESRQAIADLVKQRGIV